ncbi:MAG: exopolysaccharide biosynthesis polyprenyl glycosylphosphotransferase [Patescibacteria group bacterium]|nr:exopolysaccharide biosynthesis polyprenyl glycosylphosphotransferase [Patescibacteria group bacterium]
MHILSRKEPIVLFLGDILFFSISLWFMLFFRYAEVPSIDKIQQHIVPFSFLFIIWSLVFFIAGLYEKRAILLKNRLPVTLFNAQVANSMIAVLFFYLIPYFVITPKTGLFLYLVISFILVLCWRIYIYPLFGSHKKEQAILIGSGEVMEELKNEVNTNSRYDLHFISSINLDDLSSFDFKEDILNRIYSDDVQVIVVDLGSDKIDSILAHLYNLIFSKVKFVDMYKIYEDIFDRVPLSLLKYSWFLENISLSPNVVYDILKRITDVILSFILGLISLTIYPFVYIVIKLDDGGSLFSYQVRVGQNNRNISIIKFRTMTIANDEGKWGQKENKITRIGKFLRKTRIDELPQLWNVLKGDISLIGPRPEFPEPVKRYTDEIPYYNIRHIIKPGLSGWAQLYHERHPHHNVDTKETKNKLSYDLYYIKNRSFILDIIIALKTIKALLSRGGV